MVEMLGRIFENLGDRVGGPMTFRFILQPAVAVFLGVRDGLRLGRAGAPFINWDQHRRAGTRHPRITMVWHSIRVLVLVALILDLIYQVVVQGSVYPGEAVIVGLTITLTPYLLVCSVVSAYVYYKARLEKR